MLIPRDRYLQALIDRKGNGMIKVVTGIRRCGKSYLLFEIFKQHLLAEGVAPSQIVELALDDAEYEEYRDPERLGGHLRQAVSGAGPFYVFLDEVQYAITAEEMRGEQPPRVYGVLNGLLRKQNVDVYVTGSNSRFLSSDVLTEFRGRGDEVRIRPLSFAEFMHVYDGDEYRGWNDYLTFGGMPVVAGLPIEEQKVRYLERLFTETYLKGVVARYGVAKPRELGELVDVVASNIGSLTNPSRIANTFRSETGAAISEGTVATYLAHLREAFLIEEAQRYDVKGRRYIGSPKKYYFEDLGLRNARLGFRQLEENHLMENALYNELRARGFSVDVGVVEKRGRREGRYYRSRLEVDFVANFSSRRYYIQSAYDMQDEAKRAQEKASLIEVPDSFRKIIVVGRPVKIHRDEHGITTMSVYDFLLNPDSLDA